MSVDLPSRLHRAYRNAHSSMSILRQQKYPKIKLARARGIVLLMVLWVIVLLTVLVSSYVQSASTEGQQARFMLNTTQARYAAEAGMHRAIFELYNPTTEMRWKGDGRPYEMSFDGANVTIEIVDETGKIDINSGDQKLLAAMFARAGVEPLRAEKLAGAVVDWRDPDELLSINGAEKGEYISAGLKTGPRNQYFVTVSELQQVLGMDYELFQRLEPMLTITSNGTSVPNLAFAQLDALAVALAQMGQNLSQEQLQAIIAMRQLSKPGIPITLPGGITIPPAMGGGQGGNYTIKVLAVLASGAKATLEATVQLSYGTVGDRPYRTSRWREGHSN